MDNPLRSVFSFHLMLKTNSLRIRAIVLVCAVFACHVSSASEVRVVSSDDSGVEFVWSSGIQSAKLHGTSDLRAVLRSADWITQSGALIPVIKLLVACPTGSTPRLEVQRVETRLLSMDLPPAEELPEVSSAVNTDVRISGVEQWRGFTIAHIEIRAASPSSQGTSVLETVHATVRFVGGLDQKGPFAREEKLLKDLVINGREATHWWTPSSRILQSLDASNEAWPDIQLHKLAVTETGFHVMTAEWLQVQGIQVVGVASDRIRMFGNGGRLLPAGLISVPDSMLKEISILIEDGNDGSIDQGDRIIFYGEGLKGFDYCDGSLLNDHGHASPYSMENIYWIGIGGADDPGLRMDTIQSLSQTVPVDTVLGQVYLDQEQFIYAVSGLQSNSGVVWYMATLDASSTRTISVNLDAVSSGRGSLRIRMDSISGSGNNFNVYVNDTPVSIGAYTTPLTIQIPEGVFRTGSNTVRFENNTTRQILLNYIEVEYDKTLQSATGVIEFPAPRNQTGAFRYETGLNQDAYLAEISNPLSPRIARGSIVTDSSFAAGQRRYFGANQGGSRFRTPVYRGRKSFDASDYQMLRDPANEAGIVIITYDDWYDELEPLIAMHAQYEEEPLKAVRVKISHIYDEFSWGVKDPTAIRNFLRYAHENWRGPAGNAESPRYVLFVGDGDYDYRNLTSSSDDNWIPPWESLGTCTDDYYVDFDDSESLLDMMSGRWPVQSASEVEAIVEKTVNYALTPLYGPWKNTATFVADDEWKSGFCSEDFHTEDSEDLINDVLPEYFTFRKLYQILYPFRQSTSTSLKPDGTRDLIETINSGTLLVNYVGHGNERVWTDEQLFVMDRDFPLIDNHRLWPVIVAGTCTWGGFDRPNERCFPELLLGADDVGSIACIAATRFTFVSQNQLLTEEFYREIFRQGIEMRRSLGEALLLVKPLRADNKLYHTLGNPVLRLATPEYFAHVDQRDDSLQAGGLFQLSGFVSRTDDSNESHQSPQRRNIDEDVWADFQGIVEARVFDSEDSAAYYFPNPANCSVPLQTPFYYGLPGNAIFRGRSSIVNGRFNVVFRVPRDIQYGGENAKVSLYFFGKSESESDSADGIGIEQPLRIASAAAAVTDTVPPVIGAWLENTSFRSGDQVSRSPRLIVRLSDESGLNLSGEVGHKITARIDEAQAEDITQFFNYDVDSYTDGELVRTIGPLSEGFHRLTVEAWDSFNNLNLKTLDFVVGQQAEEGFAINDVLNWPNPMSSETYFTYSLTQEGTRDVRIRVFTISGKLVAELDGLGTRQLYNSNSDRPWLGRDDEGYELANGVYFYKVIATHERGYSAEATGKLVILR